ncbi:MAG: CPBP family intramembrane glutamic endopeptidase [Bacillota bacterium]
MFSILVIPITEEMFFRGYVLNGTFEKLKFGQISLLSALMFSIPHWFFGGDYSMLIYILANIVGTFLFGLLLNNIVYLTKTIWCGLGFHWFYNYCAIAMFAGDSMYTFLVYATLGFLIIGLIVTTIFVKKRMSKS